jgi:hypothetical protein
MTLLTTQQAAAYLQIALPTFHLWKRQGRLRPTQTIAGRPFYSQEALDAVQRPKHGAPPTSGNYLDWRTRPRERRKGKAKDA